MPDGIRPRPALRALFARWVECGQLAKSYVHDAHRAQRLRHSLGASDACKGSAALTEATYVIAPTAAQPAYCSRFAYRILGGRSHRTSRMTPPKVAVDTPQSTQMEVGSARASALLAPRRRRRPGQAHQSTAPVVAVNFVDCERLE